MKKLFFAMIVTFMLFFAFAALPVSAAEIVDSGTCLSGTNVNFTWTLTDDGTLTLSGTGEMSQLYFLGKTDWYVHREKIISIVIEPGITAIYSAFQDCTNLTNVTFPDTLEKIGSFSFQNCKSLVNVALPAGVKEVSSYTFVDCRSLMCVSFLNEEINLQRGAFDGCNINLAFYGPESASAAKYHAEGSRIEYYPNKISPSTRSGRCGKNVTWFLGDDGVMGISGSGRMTDFTWTQDIPWYPLRDKIKYVVIGDGITSVGRHAFHDCFNLTEVFISDTVTEIEYSSFGNCLKLPGIKLPNGLKKLGQRAFFGCDSLVDITVPGSVSEMGPELFSGCTSLESIIIPDGITEIGIGMFDDCTSLIGVVIPDSVTEIGSMAFSDCVSLASVRIPYGVTLIDDLAFIRCSKLIYVVVPNSVNEIGFSAFKDCEKIVDINIPQGVTKIYSDTFKNCKSLTSITIPDSVTMIGPYAFAGCTGLSGITIPNSVTRICNGAFMGCTGFSGIAIPPSVKAIEEHAFQGCTGLTWLSLPREIEELNTNSNSGSNKGSYNELLTDYVFYGCNNLTVFVYPGTYAEAYLRDKGVKYDYYPDAETSSNPVFEDVHPEMYYADPIAWAVATGITAGTSATTFSPDNKCIHGQIIAFLYRAAGSPDVSGQAYYKYADPEDYYYKPILWAQSCGIMAKDMYFSVSSYCTRMEAIRYMWIYAGKKASNTAVPFTDIGTNADDIAAVAWALENSVTAGTSETTFSPNNTCTRAQIVTFLWRAFAN